MQVQRSVRVPGLLSASLSNIYSSQRLVSRLLRSARIGESLPGSGIDEDKAAWRPSQRTLTLKRFNCRRLQIHISDFIGFRSLVAGSHTGCIYADLLAAGVHSRPAQRDLLRWPQSSKYSYLKVVAPHWMKCGTQVCRHADHFVAFQGVRAWGLVFAPKDICREVVLGFTGTGTLGVAKPPSCCRQWLLI